MARLKLTEVPGSQPDDVERGDWPLKPLKRELSGRLHVDILLNLCVKALRNQDLPTGRLIGESRGQIRHGPDCRVIGPALEADLATGCISKRDAHAEVELVPALRPARRKFGHLLSQRAPNPNR